ncbi:MAG: GIY-YIG nuclease family protein [Patescibacteria group bacterium]|nr:GIY-YIG nuclease family protein [Patescibacteria group bacterium]
MKVYILESLSSGKYYIGHTNDLERRFSEHNDASRHGWSNKYAPWKIMYSADYSTRAEAMKEEKRLKSFKNKESLARLIGKE